mgnify:CR=1 FL=1
MRSIDKVLSTRYVDGNLPSFIRTLITFALYTLLVILTVIAFCLVIGLALHCRLQNLVGFEAALPQNVVTMKK